MWALFDGKGRASSEFWRSACIAVSLRGVYDGRAKDFVL